MQVVIAQFEILKDLAIGDEKQIALERRATEAEYNFVVAAKSLEEHKGAFRVKEAQLLEAVNCHRSLEEQTSSIIRETRLDCADLRQRFDAQKDEGAKLMEISRE